MKVFKVGEPIRFGVLYKSIFTNEKHFECYYSPLINPLSKTHVVGSFIKDNDWYWTPVFYIFSPQKYIITIVNKRTNEEFKEVFEVISDIFDKNDDIVIL